MRLVILLRIWKENEVLVWCLDVYSIKFGIGIVRIMEI